MKKLIILFLFISSATFAQTSFKGFFRPIDKSLFKTVQTIDGGVKVDRATSLWLVRPVVTLTATRFNLGNPVTVAPLSSLGTGVSYTHFISVNGEPYANYGANLLVLFTQDLIDGGVEPAKLSLAGTISFLQYVSVGAGYSFADRKVFLLTGIVYNFN